MFVFKHQHILDTKPCTEKYIHIFSFENIPVVPTVRALVCLWTDSQQWTGFFSHLLIRVSNSATTLSERNKIIQKNQQNQPTKNQQQQQNLTQQGLRLSELESTRKFRQIHQRMLDSYKNQACSSLKNIQPRPEGQRSTFKVMVPWKARPNKITKTKSISFKNF